MHAHAANLIDAAVGEQKLAVWRPDHIADDSASGWDVLFLEDLGAGIEAHESIFFG